MGMLADAADETILLTRYMDQEAADSADIAAEIMARCQRTMHLFVNEGAKNSGHTEHMLQYLSKARVVPVTGQHIGAEGGVYRSIWRRCQRWR